jgi:DNA-binding transcriptional LysR family regulator
LVNISQLRAFIAVVEEGSFSSAARTLGVSQPAVTMQVRGLESDVGATLLDRRYRGVDLTEAGRSLLPHALAVLKELEIAQDELDAMSGTVTGPVTVAASTTPGQYVLPNLLGDFLKANPEVTVTIAVHDTAEVVDIVESGGAQLGMVGAMVRGARATLEELGTDELMVIAPRDSGLIGRPGLTASDLAGEAFIMREQGSGTRQVAESALRAHGVEPDDLNVVTELGTSEAIVRAVEGGLGLGIVSRWVAEKAIELGTVRSVSVAGFPVARPFYVVIPRRAITRAAEEFLRHLESSLR